MDDFNALAAALGAGVADLRGCLILSRDGLVLGSHPGTAEADLKPAWIKLSAAGDPERAFVQFGTEIWCYVRRGAYAAFVVTGVAARPGLVIDEAEQALMAAEDARTKRGGAKPEAASTPTPAPPTAPKAKPRTPLHPEPKPSDEPVVLETEPATAPAKAAATEATPSAPEPEAPSEPQPPSPSESSQRPAPQRSPSIWATGAKGEDVDTFSLAREFSRLLQDDEEGADG